MIAVENLCLQVGKFRLQDAAVRVRPGCYAVLMGPTGAGKSLLLKCICGLVRPDSGNVLLDGKNVTNAEPRLRKVGYVPQGCGLFPHLSVAKNITFSLCAGGLSHAKALAKSKAYIDTLGLHPLLNRWPETLSGGERQKVALARALVLEPKALLLDEPISALDEPTQRQACLELRQTQRRLGVATIHVCHNLREAEAVADIVCILHDGRTVQSGKLSDLRDSPANADVARLLQT